MARFGLIARAAPWAGLAVLLAAGARAEPVAWRVTGESGDTWLLGSVHYLRESDYPLPDVVGTLYERADRIVMELDLDDVDAAAMQTKLVSAAMLPADRSLADVIDADLHERASERAAALGIELESLARFEPWLVALTLADLGMARHGFRPERGLEQHLLGRARRDDKPVDGLESLEAQIGVFEMLSDAEQQALLEQTLADVENPEPMMNRMIAAWRDGRFEQLGAELLAEFEPYPELYRMLVADRNRSWVEPIIEHVERPGDELVVVGALHLVGDDSLITMLEERGYAVERAAPQDESAAAAAGRGPPAGTLDFEHLEVFLARAAIGAAPR